MIKVTNKIDQWLTLKGWTRRELAKHLGMSEVMISVILSDKQKPTWRFIESVCELTGLDIGDIVRYERVKKGGGV